MAHRVTFIPGDGVGPELSEATRRVPVTEIGFMETPESSRIVLDWMPLRNSITLAASGVPCSNSMPAYRSSWFSRTTTRSMSSYRERTPR